jgi:hypothetical protein
MDFFSPPPENGRGLAITTFYKLTSVRSFYMPENWWMWTSAALLLTGLLYFSGPVWHAIREARFVRLQRDFHTQRERLEAKFIQLAAARTKPTSPRWEDCEFADDVSYVRHRLTGELSAFVAVSVTIEDPDRQIFFSGDAVSKMQIGTAVFRFDRDHWETDGRTILNLTPKEAVRHFQRDWKIVGQEYARHV